MREAKASYALVNTKKEMKTQFEDAVKKLRNGGLLRDRGHTSLRVTKTNCLAIRTPGSTPSILPFAALQNVAFATFAQRNTAAKAFGMAKDTVSKLKCLVAEVGQRSFKDHLADRLESMKTKKANCICRCAGSRRYNGNAYIANGGSG